jgi:hypothetical protein
VAIARPAIPTQKTTTTKPCALLSSSIKCSSPVTHAAPFRGSANQESGTNAKEQRLKPSPNRMLATDRLLDISPALAFDSRVQHYYKSIEPPARVKVPFQTALRLGRWRILAPRRHLWRCCQSSVVSAVNTSTAITQGTIVLPGKAKTIASASRRRGR